MCYTCIELSLDYLLHISIDRKGYVVNGWSLSVEAFSLVITIILMINFHDKKPVSRQSRLYQSILWLSVFTIGWNILCVWTIEYASLFPLWINELLNTQYFILLILLCTLIAYYLICAVLEHLYSRQYLRRVAWILGLVMGIYLVAILTNPWTGAIFRFDEQGYHRGPWINLGYAVMGFDLAFLGLCYLQHWHRVSRPIRRVMFVLPTTVVCMTVFQLMYPEVLLNGSIIVVANLILFLNFQMRRLDTDSLTCLGNRSHFYGYLSQHLAAHQNCQILVVSLRQFGMVNQRLGHRRGDGILYEIACWLDRFHRQGRAFRLSNVSFALLLPYTTAAQADCNRKRVQKRFAESWRLGSAEVTLGCSMAELCYTGQPWSAEEMLEFLEYGLQQAEESENGVVRFDLQMHEQFLRRQKLLVLMRRGIVENRFSVWYQPLYHCVSGRFCSAEALLRLRDEEGKIISPGEFIPLAEQTGLIDDLSWVVLEQSCRMLSRTSPRELSSISINLSMQQFVSEDLVQRIGDCLRRYKVSPSRLKIEITERVLTQDFNRMKTVMEALSKIGVKFYLDDFGTGYSNLSSVLDLHFEYIKIDHSLVASLPDDRKSMLMLRTLIPFFHKMGCQVVVEGIEREEQAGCVRSCGADWLQGYLYAHPMPVEDFLPFMTSNRQLQIADC